MISPHAGASAETGSPTSHHLSPKPDAFPALTQIPTIDVRKEEHSDHMVPGGSPGSTGA